MSSERVRMTSTAPVAVTPNRPGQDARLAFEGVAGQQVKLIVSDSTFDTGNFVASAIVSILDSLETTVISQTVHAQGDEIDTDPLSDIGTHTVMVKPAADQDCELNPDPE
jgi:hypothetical protein